MSDLKNRVRTLLTKLLIGTVGSLILFLLGYSYLFGPMDKYATTTEFLVEPEMSSMDIARTLKDQGFIRSEYAFEAAHLSSANGRTIRPGGYKISKAMDTWTIADTLTKKPYLAWIVVKPGMRKEQIADMLVEYLSWSPEEREEWLTIHTAPTPSFVEGVYYPDTYLIPSKQSPKDVADRLRTRFQEVFAPYANEALAEGKDWTDVVNLASIVEREAAKNDKALVAAILWNRLEIDMPLQADATLQYIKGNKDNGWWPVPKSEDKFLDSPFNTYQHDGLPPHPIANPSLDSIDAVLNPEPTNCIYYLHDANGRIHCSTNYAGHRDNINRYLR